MNPAKRVADLLEASGAVLLRAKRHLVFGLPNGQKVTMASTPSDCRGSYNELRDLRSALGEVDPSRGSPGARRERVAKPGRQGGPLYRAPGSAVSLAEQLHLAYLERTVQELAMENTQLEDAMRVCWGCQLRRFWLGVRVRVCIQTRRLK